MDLSGPQVIGVLPQGTTLHGKSDLCRLWRLESPQMIHHILGGSSRQNLRFEGEELFDTLPMIGDQARTGTCRFKDSGWRRKSDAGHGVAIYVQHHASRRVHNVMHFGWYVPQPANIRGQFLVGPTFSAQYE